MLDLAGEDEGSFLQVEELEWELEDPVGEVGRGWDGGNRRGLDGSLIVGCRSSESSESSLRQTSYSYILLVPRRSLLLSHVSQSISEEDEVQFTSWSLIIGSTITAPEESRSMRGRLVLDVGTGQDTYFQICQFMMPSELSILDTSWLYGTEYSSKTCNNCKDRVNERLEGFPLQLISIVVFMYKMVQKSLLARWTPPKYYLPFSPDVLE